MSRKDRRVCLFTGHENIASMVIELVNLNKKKTEKLEVEIVDLKADNPKLLQMTEEISRNRGNILSQGKRVSSFFETSKGVETFLLEKIQTLEKMFTEQNEKNREKAVNRNHESDLGVLLRLQENEFLMTIKQQNKVIDSLKSRLSDLEENTKKVRRDGMLVRSEEDYIDLANMEKTLNLHAVAVRENTLSIEALTMISYGGEHVWRIPNWSDKIRRSSFDA